MLLPWCTSSRMWRSTSTPVLGPANATLEEGVAGKTVQPEKKADRALRVARRVQDAQGDVLERQRRLVGQRGIDGKSRKARGHEGQLRETLPIEDGEVVRVHG